MSEDNFFVNKFLYFQEKNQNDYFYNSLIYIFEHNQQGALRSEERRVGKECER